MGGHVRERVSRAPPPRRGVRRGLPGRGGGGQRLPSPRRGPVRPGLRPRGSELRAPQGSKEVEGEGRGSRGARRRGAPRGGAEGAPDGVGVRPGEGRRGGVSRVFRVRGLGDDVVPCGLGEGVDRGVSGIGRRGRRRRGSRRRRGARGTRRRRPRPRRRRRFPPHSCCCGSREGRGRHGTRPQGSRAHRCHRRKRRNRRVETLFLLLLLLLFAVVLVAKVPFFKRRVGLPPSSSFSPLRSASGDGRRRRRRIIQIRGGGRSGCGEARGERRGERGDARRRRWRRRGLPLLLLLRSVVAVAAALPQGGSGLRSRMRLPRSLRRCCCDFVGVGGMRRRRVSSCRVPPGSSSGSSSELRSDSRRSGGSHGRGPRQRPPCRHVEQAAELGSGASRSRAGGGGGGERRRRRRRPRRRGERWRWHHARPGRKGHRSQSRCRRRDARIILPRGVGAAHRGRGCCLAGGLSWRRRRRKTECVEVERQRRRRERQTKLKEKTESSLIPDALRSSPLLRLLLCVISPLSPSPSPDREFGACRGGFRAWLGRAAAVEEGLSPFSSPSMGATEERANA